MGKEFPYEDIINLPPHISEKYPQASMEDRAARFSPFAAITGYEDMVKEAARVTSERINLDESLKRILDEKLNEIRRNLSQHPMIMIEYFVPDTKKIGGDYVRITGNIKRMDDYRRSIVLTSGENIEIDDILELEIL